MEILGDSQDDTVEDMELLRDQPISTYNYDDIQAEFIADSSDNDDKRDEDLIEDVILKVIVPAKDQPTKLGESKYGIHTPCILEGKPIVAFVDGGASISFIAKKFVDQMRWNIEPKNGQLRLAFIGANTKRIGIVRDKLLQNGKHSVKVNLKVAELGDEETLIIGLNLFAKLSYSIEGVPFTWPQEILTTTKSSAQDVKSSPIPGVNQEGIADEWKTIRTCLRIHVASCQELN